MRRRPTFGMVTLATLRAPYSDALRHAFNNRLGAHRFEWSSLMRCWLIDPRHLETAMMITRDVLGDVEIDITV